MLTVEMPFCNNTLKTLSKCHIWFKDDPKRNNTIGSYIRSKISDEIKESKLFSVATDEAADISNKEQLCLVLTFVDAIQQILEEFIGFYHFEARTSGEVLK